MRLTVIVLLALLSLSGAAFAGDSQLPPDVHPNFSLDSQMILPATADPAKLTAGDISHACFSMRTYRVRKDMDRGSVLPATPDQVSFDPDSIVGYSTCQSAAKYTVKTTR